MAFSDIMESLGLGLSQGMQSIEDDSFRREEEERRRQAFEMEHGLRGLRMREAGYSEIPKPAKGFDPYAAVRIGNFVKTGPGRDELEAVAAGNREEQEAMARRQRVRDLLPTLAPVFGGEKQAQAALDIYEMAPGMAAGITSRMIPRAPETPQRVTRTVRGVGLVDVTDPDNPKVIMPEGRTGGAGGGERRPTPSEQRMGRQEFMEKVINAYGADYKKIGEALYRDSGLREEMQRLGIDSNHFAAAVNERKARDARGKKDGTKTEGVEGTGVEAARLVAKRFPPEPDESDSVYAARLKKANVSDKMIDQILKGL